MTTVQSFPTILEGTPEELSSIVNKLPKYRYRVEIRELVEPERDYLAEAILKMNSRTPEQVLADRAEVFASSPTPTPIPPGKTFDDMVMGQWPGDETDEEIRLALEELS